MKLSKNNNQAFTIIETLVAISILLISITGPLTIAEKGLTAAVSSQDQLTASYLAQDLMEYVKNVRDDNLLSNTSWINVFSNCTAVAAKQIQGGYSGGCDYDTTLTSPSISTCTPGPVAGLCQLYLTMNGTYSPNISLDGTVTKFSRSFVVVPLNGSGSFTTATSSLVTVTVGWSTGTISNEVILQDVIFDTLR